VDDDAFPGREYMTGNATIVDYPDLPLKITLGYPGVQFPRFRVVQEYRPPVRLDFPGGYFHQDGEHLVQGFVGRHGLGDIEQQFRLV